LSSSTVAHSFAAFRAAFFVSNRAFLAAFSFSFRSLADISGSSVTYFVMKITKLKKFFKNVPEVEKDASNRGLEVGAGDPKAYFAKVNSQLVS